VEEEDVRQAARAMRPYLNELLTNDEAALELDRRLAELLAEGQAGRSVKADLLIALSGQEATRKWTREFLKDKTPPQVYRTWRRPPGDPGRVPAQRWVCPQGDYDWYSSSAGEQPPACPTHHLDLVQDGA
jgi:hypothetical protein